MAESLIIFGVAILALLGCIYFIYHYETGFSREVNEFIMEDIRKWKEEEEDKLLSKTTLYCINSIEFFVLGEMYFVSYIKDNNIIVFDEIGQTNSFSMDKNSPDYYKLYFRVIH